MKKEEVYVVIDSEPKRLRAIHKLRYYKEPIFSLSDIFSENPYNKCLEFYDDEWIVLGYDDKDIKKKTEISLDQLDQMLNPQFVVKDVILPFEELQKQAELHGWKLVKEEQENYNLEIKKLDKLKNQLFIGKVICELGFKKTIELLKESKIAFQDETNN
jgi:hypothetical protein